MTTSEADLRRVATILGLRMTPTKNKATRRWFQSFLALPEAVNLYAHAWRESLLQSDDSTHLHFTANCLIVWITPCAPCYVFLLPGFPRGDERIEKVLNCDIGFQDLKRELNLANKLYISIEEKPFVYSNFVLHRWWQFCRYFLQCVTRINLRKNEDNWWY